MCFFLCVRCWLFPVYMYTCESVSLCVCVLLLFDRTMNCCLIVSLSLFLWVLLLFNFTQATITLSFIGNTQTNESECLLSADDRRPNTTKCHKFNFACLFNTSFLLNISIFFFIRCCFFVLLAWCLIVKCWKFNEFAWTVIGCELSRKTQNRTNTNSLVSSLLSAFCLFCANLVGFGNSLLLFINILFTHDSNLSEFHVFLLLLLCACTKKSATFNWWIFMIISLA